MDSRALCLRISSIDKTLMLSTESLDSGKKKKVKRPLLKSPKKRERVQDQEKSTALLTVRPWFCIIIHKGHREKKELLMFARPQAKSDIETLQIISIEPNQTIPRGANWSQKKSRNFSFLIQKEI